MYTNETVAFGSAMLFMFVYYTIISYDYCLETRSKIANVSCNKIIVRYFQASSHDAAVRDTDPQPQIMLSVRSFQLIPWVDLECVTARA